MTAEINVDSYRVLEKAHRLIVFALGDDYWGFDEPVRDVGIGIAESWGDDDTVWVTGNWNIKRSRYQAEQTGIPLTKEETLPERLSDALGRLGVELLWLDEWLSCDDCQRAFRCQPDSYSWRMQGIITDSGSILCRDHAIEDLEWLISDDGGDFINNHTKAITLDVDLSSIGFERYNGLFANGWYRDQDDDPKEIAARAERYGWQERVFTIDNVGQFDVHFLLWVRNNEDESEEEEE